MFGFRPLKTTVKVSSWITPLHARPFPRKPCLATRHTPSRRPLQTGEGKAPLGQTGPRPRLAFRPVRGPNLNGKAANTIIELIQKHAASVGCSNPDGLTINIGTGQCNAIMVDQVRRACRGLKPNAVRHDDDWLPAAQARAALRPYGRYGRPVATPSPNLT
jgi:hypothetical protein